MSCSVLWGISAAFCFVAAVVLSPRLPGACAPVLLRRVLDGAALLCAAIAVIAAR